MNQLPQIRYEATSRTFHLMNEKISYLMKVEELGKLIHLHFGQRVPHREDFDHLFIVKPHAMYSSVVEWNNAYSYEAIRQEFPDFGGSDTRVAAVKLRQENGSSMTDFRYQDHRIFAGKKTLPGLPASYVEEDAEAQTLEIDLFDELLGVTATLSYTIFRDQGAIARHVRLKNDGSQTLFVEKLASLSMDLADADYEWLQFSGSWGRERHIKERHLQQGSQSISSRRGNSSHNHNPSVVLKRVGTDERQGEVLATTFVYSGNFLMEAEVDTFDVTRLQVGIHPDGFCWQLAPGADFQAPEALLFFSADGLNGMSRECHSLLQTRVAKGYWRDRPRPILLNNWEATYFDFTEEKLLAIAKTAKDVGVELFVLDDGWFGERTNDRAGLGDWAANLARLPEGIAGLSEKVEALGLKFGLWFEPEMVNKDSELFRKHPDWIIATPQRPTSHYRHQYVLDYSRPEVVEAIHQQMAEIFRTSKIAYVKWDMNRSISEAFSAGLPSQQQGEVYHRYILGVYELYRRLTEEFPEILFESCSSGGGRFDAGILHYAPQGWTSDNSDAISRLKIQYGTSMIYPVSAIGAHVSIVPNHQVQRVTPLSTRSNVAMFGTFGYELDLNELTAEELTEVKQQISFVKAKRETLQQGRFYRLLSPFAGNHTAWMSVAADGNEAVIGYYQVLQEADAPLTWLRLQGLEPDSWYQLAGERYSGAELMQIGVSTTLPSDILPEERSDRDFASKLWVLKKV